MKILIINGPNLNFLGIREPHIYGDTTYKDICKQIQTYCKQNKIKVKIIQTNHEGKIIDLLQKSHFNLKLKGIILNAGGYTHTSVAIKDAISSINKPVIEVHLSDISKREDFRKISLITENCVATFMGEHLNSYIKAINYLKDME